MLKGIITGVCVYVLLFLVYMTFRPVIGQFIGRVTGTVSAAPQLPKNVALHYIVVTAIGVLVGVLVRDLYLYLRVILRRPEKTKPRS